MALSAGSIAFVAFNADGNDGFAFLALDEIPAGTTIYFRDDGWSGTAFNTGEGIIAWTNNTGSAIAPGSLIELLNTGSGTLSVNVGTAAFTGGTTSLNLGASGEVLYAYTSTGTATSGTFTFLTAFANSGFNSTNGSLDKTSLVAGTNAVGFSNGHDVFAYNPASGGNNFANKSAALVVIHNLSNWVSQDGSGNQDGDDTSPDAPFLTDDQSPLKGVTFTIGTGGGVQTFTPNPGTTQDSSDASTAIALDSNWMVVGDDEANVLRVYPRAGGAAVLEWSFGMSLGIGSNELDLEASTRIGNTLYFIGSHSNSSGGNEENNREYLFSVTVSGTGAATVFTFGQSYGGLEAALVAWDSGNVHGLGANYFGFAAASANGVAPEQVSGFSIEGLTASQDGTQLLLAFRAPQSPTTSRDKALIVPLTVASAFSGTPVFGTPIELNLGGRGIRSIEKAEDGNGYLILAGPAGVASDEVTHDFRLFRWNGTSTTPTELDVDLDSLRAATGGSFETLVAVPNTAQGTPIQLLMDNGDTLWPGKSQASKSLPAAEQQFQGFWVTLGGNVTDTTAPTLTSSTPADDATNVPVNANLVLRFNEGVKAGAGQFVIKKTADNSVVETINANDTAKVSVAYNTVTINPTNDLSSGVGYYLETSGTAVTDHYGNLWGGLSGATAFNFTTAGTITRPSYSLLITEVNSNATGGDFFELYNYGTTAIDLSNWRFNDDQASFNGTKALTIPTGTGLAPGARMVILTDSANATNFRTAWGLPDSVPVVAITGAATGLGSADAVTVFDANGYFVTGFNYKAAGSNITITDPAGSVVLAPALRSDSQNAAGGHAGPSMGGVGNGVSAVWDGVSTATPAYKGAVVNQIGAYAQTGNAANIGSPGRIASGHDLSQTSYSETFVTNLGDFIVYSVDTDTTNTWYRPAAGYAEVNAFGDSAAANDWLISKSFDLSKTTVEYLSFSTWTRFADSGVANPEVTLRYSTNYPGYGNPTANGVVWTELPYAFPAENSQVWTPSGLIDLSAINGTNVYFAFQYTSSGTGSNNSTQWRVDNFSLTGYTGAVLNITATDAIKLEGDTGTTAFTFTVTRSGNTSGTTTVDWAVSGSGANPANAADFDGGVLPSGQVSFAAGETSKTLTILVNGDTTVESNETFTVTLSNASAGAAIHQTSATGTIQNDDVVITLISAVQGSGNASPKVGQSVSIQGVLTAWLPGFAGFYVQEETADYDNDPMTSEGIFVYYGTNNPGVNAGRVGDIVRVTGTVAEYNGLTELTSLTGFTVMTDHPDTSALPAPVAVTLPVADMALWESLEGMRVTVSSGTSGGRLVVTDNYNLGRYGQVTLTSDDLLLQFTEANAPSVSGNTAYNALIQKDQIILDDGMSAQNPAVHYGRNGEPLSATNPLRAGDWIDSVTGVLDQFATGGELGYETTYRIQPTMPPNFTGNARPTAADLQAMVTGAEIKVASVNVLNYFTTLGTTKFTNPYGTEHDPRGATNAAEFTRQQDKIVAALLGMDADVYGLMEMQNNGFADGTSAIDSLVDALNAVAGAGTYAYISAPYRDGVGADEPTAGNDAIMVVFLYKTATITPVGQAAVPDVGTYPAFTATYGNRVPVAQTFESKLDGERFIVVANHFKSKGSVIDPDTGDGQGANNQARLQAAQDLVAWLATNPTGSGDGDILLIGDFNAYSKEDPLTYFTQNGYTKVSSGLSYSFDGLWGSLDHAFASTSLVSQVTGAVKWAINAEEPAVLDYNLEFKNDIQDATYYASDVYRSSDHNPILIGLNLDSIAPVLQSVTRQGSNKILLGFSEVLDAVNLPPAHAFVVQIGGINWTPFQVAVNGNTVELTMATTFLANQVVRVSYTDPNTGNDSNAIQDVVGNDVASFANLLVPTATGIFKGDNGNDMVLVGDNSVSINVGNGDNMVQTGNGHNTVLSGSGNDTIVSGSGNDRIDAGNGHNSIQAGEGNNSITTGSGNDTVVSGSGNDRITTGAGNDRIFAGAGSDTINAGSGDDFIVGGPGRDQLTGGAGADVFVFMDLAEDGPDTITDFSNTNKLLFDTAVFTQLVGATANNLRIGTAPLDADDYLVYNSARGVLMYDADGNGPGNGVPIVVITGTATKNIGWSHFDFFDSSVG